MLLARRGVDVLLLEKSEFPRAKVCGCCLSATSLQVLEQCGLGAMPSELKAVQHRSLSIQTRHHQISFPLSKSVSISRSAFDAALVEQAKDAGVQFFPRTSGQITATDVHGVTIEGESSQGKYQLRTRIAIAADGLAGSALSDTLGMRTDSQRDSRVGSGAISKDTSHISEHTIHMSYADGGYVGLVRLEDGTVDIAAALDLQFLRRNHTPANAVRWILEDSHFPVPADLDTITWRGTVALTQRRRKVAANRIFVIGDSASYIEPFTGEGIAWALTCATLVAPLAERGALIWHPSLARQWAEVYNKNIRLNQKKTSAIAWLLKHRLLSNVAGSIIVSSPNLAKPLAQLITKPNTKEDLTRCRPQ